ncbi:MAG: hypothetical protein ABUK11_09015 [Mariprofundaceae bacterium]
MLRKSFSILITALFALTGSSVFASDQQQGVVKKWQPQTPRVKKEVRTERHLKQQQLKDEDEKKRLNRAATKQGTQMPQKMQQPKSLNTPLNNQMEQRLRPPGGTP